MKTNDYKAAAEALQNADAILLSASNGLSIAEGYHIFADNEAFEQYFSEFKKYGVRNIITGALSSFPGHDKFMAQLHKYMIDDYNGSGVFRDLLDLVNTKPYFVVTSNGDTHFQINGFDPQRIFEVEGNFFGLQMQSPEWQAQNRRFQEFIGKYQNVVVLELGIGARNQIIKAPLMQLVAQRPDYQFITLNMPREINVPAEISDRSIALTGDIAATLKEVKQYEIRNVQTEPERKTGI